LSADEILQIYHKGLSERASRPSPANGATGVSVTTDLSWTAGASADTHDVYFGTASTPPLVSNSQTDTTYDPGTLTNGTTYYWRIDANNISGITPGDVWSFMTSPPPPPQPPTSITYPTSSNTGQYTVSWASSTGATSYQLEQSSNSGSTWSQIYSGASISYGENIGNGSYRYRVKATNALGSSGWTTGTSDCVVTAPPVSPISISYPTSSSTGQYTVKWSSSSGATSYQLGRSSDRGATWSQVYSGKNTSYQENIGNGSYRYRVKATNAIGSSNWTTSIFDCVVLRPPSPPTGVSASDGTYTGKVQVSWNASSGAMSYEIWRNTRNKSSTASKIAEVPSSLYDDTSVVARTTYWYWVKAKNSVGTSGFSSSDSGKTSQ
jgi:predicted phage tail protein